ncbi:uncharacterized protein B0H64DRAFT_446295 [Chaetomium fimeti]|uniref:Uncharacterized protein n=1 Tax=Chaetomium fimeti TaxID=1854472 RepID=A0AAE0H9W6_9PEZI|nr:hypothetical protein B0H64DRAFT_446295 [Chaetomium fimeti]
MSLTDGIDMLAAGTLEQAFDIAIGAYRQALIADKAPWVQGLDVDTAVHMARLTRPVVYFVDLYINIRIQYFRHKRGPPCGTWSASQAERCRVAQALIRYQIIASLHHPAFHQATKADHFFINMLGLFQSWELEQVSEISHFVFSTSDCFRRELAKDDPRARISGFYDHFRAGYDANYLPKLPEFYAKLTEAQRSDGELPARLMLNPRATTGKERGPPPRAALELLRGLARGPVVRIGFDGDSPTDPPWAWIDAWNGERVVRWGHDLVPERASDGNWGEHRYVRELAYSWRWLGMVFWDRDRAEALLTAKVLEGCGTGWLAEYWQRAGHGESYVIGVE